MERLFVLVGSCAFLFPITANYASQNATAESRTHAVNQIQALQEKVMEALKASNKIQAEALLENILQVAATYNLGSDPSMEDPLRLISLLPQTSGNSALVDHALRLPGLSSRELTTMLLCNQVSNSLVVSTGGSPPTPERYAEISTRFPVCKEVYSRILAPPPKNPSSEEEAAIRMLPTFKRDWEDAKRTKRQVPGISARAIAMLSLLSGDDDGARKYILEMQEDLSHFNATKNLSLPGLPEVDQAESRDEDPSFSALSLAAFYHLALHPADEEIKQNALQLVLTGKNREVDDARDTIRILRDPPQNGRPELLAQLREQYETGSKEWVAIGVKGAAIPIDREQAAAEKLRPLENQIHSLVDPYSKTFGRRQTPSVADLQASLGSDDRLVEFAQVWWPDYHPERKRTFDLHPTVADTHYIAYVFRRHSAVGFDLGPVIAINKAIANYRLSMKPDTDDKWRGSAHTLYATLWKPLLSALPPVDAARGRVYVAPDGDLSLLPFDGLLDASNRFLVQSWNISYVTSGRELVDRTTRQNGSDTSHSGVVVFANPTFPSKVPPIPGTAKEARDIAATLPHVTVYEGLAASRVQLKAISSPLILHLATHGEYSVDREVTSETESLEDLVRKKKYGFLRSWLLLSNGSPIRPLDSENYVTSLEMALLDLRNTALVVLSACDSGMGSLTPGTSVTGLRSAFKMAGAEASISSLWSEDDESGEQLMAGFYKGLRSNGKTGNASINDLLRQAKLQTMAKFPHPYYWAFFVFDGQDQVLRF